jgi:hypothetical protein
LEKKLFQGKFKISESMIAIKDYEDCVQGDSEFKNEEATLCQNMLRIKRKIFSSNTSNRAGNVAQ